jgi:hypothetical protein
MATVLAVSRDDVPVVAAWTERRHSILKPLTFDRPGRFSPKQAKSGGKIVQNPASLRSGRRVSNPRPSAWEAMGLARCRAKCKSDVARM